MGAKRKEGEIVWEDKEEEKQIDGELVIRVSGVFVFYTFP